MSIVSRQLDFTDQNGHSIAPADAPHPLAILSNAVKAGANAETLDRMSALAERWVERQEQGNFGHAIAGFQAEMPPIKKDRKGGHGNYAGFDDVMTVAKPLLSKHGISVGFDTKQSEKGLTVVCRLRVGGYFEDREFTIPIPSDMRVNDSQKFGAALTYAKRYALCAALNIITSDKDTDGRGLTDFIDQPKVKEIADLIKQTDSDLTQFLAVYEIDSLSELTFDDYRDAQVKLLTKKNRKVTK